MQKSNSVFYILAFSGIAISYYFATRNLKRKTNQKKSLSFPETLPETTKGKVTRIEPIDILGKVTPDSTYKFAFDIDMGTFEKLAVSESEISDMVWKFVPQVIGEIVGKPVVNVDEIDDGYHISVIAKTYEDVRTDSKGRGRLKAKIEQIDSRLKGRIKNVIVTRL